MSCLFKVICSTLDDTAFNAVLVLFSSRVGKHCIEVAADLLQCNGGGSGCSVGKSVNQIMNPF